MSAAEPSTLGSFAHDQSTTGRQALSIALLIAARSFRPPLCVGIFGAEGSGVTFFLRQIALQVETLSTGPVTPGGSHDSQFCTALQINYNPWHYVGANQWLALAERIFETVQESARDGRDRDAREDGLWQIGTAGKLLRELESKREASMRVAAIEDAALSRADRKYADAVKQNAEQQSQSHQTELNDRFAKHADEKQLARSIDECGGKLGLRDLSRNATGLRKVLAQAKTPMGRAALLTSTLTAQKHIGNVVLMVLVALLIGGASWILASMYSEMHDVGKWVEAVQNGLGALATVGTFLVLVVALMLGNRALTAVDTLQGYARDLDEVVAAVSRQRRYERLVAAQREAASLRQVEDSRTRVAEAQRTLGLAEQAITDLRSAGVQRAVIDAYRSLITTHQDVQPALVPMIREDFEALSRFLLEPRRSGEVDRSRPDRIVIYIDDLDRCPPAVVVDVIQAVQLLLAFPIFVVVIGANPTWLMGALAARYTDLRIDPSDAMSTEAVSTHAADMAAAASRVGTLAKFIHVPFWMRPISSEGAARLVRAMVASPGDSAPSGAVQSPSSAPSDMPPTIAMPMSPIAGVERSSVAITDDERVFLERIAAVLSRWPRDVKRLANCYRILRAMLPVGDLEALTSHEDASRGYLAAITQLAIVVAAPLSAPRYVQLMAHAVRLDDLIAALETDEAIYARERDAILSVLGLYRQTSGANDVRGLRDWIELAARHSFTVPPALAEQGAHAAPIL